MAAQNVAEIIQNHVMLEVENIDRMYLNGYMPGFLTEGGFIYFMRKHLGYPVASTGDLIHVKNVCSCCKGVCP